MATSSSTPPQDTSPSHTTTNLDGTTRVSLKDGKAKLINIQVVNGTRNSIDMENIDVEIVSPSPPTSINGETEIPIGLRSRSRSAENCQFGIEPVQDEYQLRELPQWVPMFVYSSQFNNKLF